MRVCRDCKNKKETAEFVKNKAFKDGIDTLCLECNRIRVRAWRKMGKRDVAKEARLYYHRYPEKGRAKAQARSKRTRTATPNWVKLTEIELIYQKCPPGHHVDHIVPLRGEMVSGLHVPWNLQYLPAKENIRKGNKCNLS